MPPHADELLVEDPSLLHLTHRFMGGFHMTSMILGALEGSKVTLNFFRIKKFDMLAEATALERFPERAVLDKIVEMELCQGILVLENLS